MLSNSDILNQKFIDKFNLSVEDSNLVLTKSYTKRLKKGEFLYFNDVCYGYAFLKFGFLRAYLVSDNLKEITLFTLKGGEECLICNDCFIKNFSSNLNLSAIDDCEILIIPIEVFKNLSFKYTTIQNHIIDLMAIRFSDSVKAMEQALFTPLTKRIRHFLFENSSNNRIKITHEEIAMHLGSAREAVSRILKEMQNDGEILQNKGSITIVNLSL
ncbi:MAG: Crp/Fnr family transcriptional regulator [Campylobacter sp.]|nr:Crp/Fnr family transcriptional regulator [Campylobacter sp.]